MAFSSDDARLFALVFAEGTLAVFIATTYNRIREVAHISDMVHSRPTAIAFVPGEPTWTVASVAADGWCKIIDVRSGQILRSWTVSQPATSLAVIRNPQDQTDVVYSAGGSCILAIGRENGDVLLYDGFGHRLFRQKLEANGPIVDLEWYEGTSVPIYHSRSTSSHRSKSPGRRRVMARSERHHDMNGQHNDAKTDPSHNDADLHVQPLRLPTPKPGKVEILRVEPHVPVPSPLIQQTRQSRSSDLIPPAIPPRPVGRAGGKLAERRAKSSQEAKATQRPDAVVEQAGTTENSTPSASSHLDWNYPYSGDSKAEVKGSPTAIQTIRRSKSQVLSADLATRMESLLRAEFSALRQEVQTEFQRQRESIEEYFRQSQHHSSAREVHNNHMRMGQAKEGNTNTR